MAGRAELRATYPQLLGNPAGSEQEPAHQRRFSAFRALLFSSPCLIPIVNLDISIDIIKYLSVQHDGVVNIMGRDKNLSPSKDFCIALARYQPANDRQAAVLVAWREDIDKDCLWRALQRAASKRELIPPEPADFIGVVLGATMPASQLNNHSADTLKQFERLKRKIAEVVQDAIYPLDLWRDLQRFASALRDLDRSDYDMHAAIAVGGRSDINQSRDRKLFAQRLFRYLKNSCGEYLVAEVTLMLDIIYPNPQVAHDTSLVRRWLAEISPKTV
jgi:hypothetical protein